MNQGLQHEENRRIFPKKSENRISMMYFTSQSKWIMHSGPVLKAWKKEPWMGSDQNQRISMDLHVTLLDNILHQDDEMYGDNFKALIVCNLYAGPTHVAKRACCKISSDSDASFWISSAVCDSDGFKAKRMLMMKHDTPCWKKTRQRVWKPLNAVVQIGRKRYFLGFKILYKSAPRNCDNDCRSCRDQAYVDSKKILR